MNTKLILSAAAAAIVGAMTVSTTAQATAVTVVNPSFETSYAQPYNCGVNCSWNTSGIPGWAGEGSFNPGPPATTTYFNYVPDGITVAYSNGGSISQTVSAAALANRTYILQVDLGYRKDYADNGNIELVIGSHTIFGTGAAPQGSGDWATWTASFTTSAADIGAPISIVLNSPGAQGDFDNVRLDVSSGVPEPATWALMLGGFGLAGAALRRRRATVAA